jgi:cysteine desulfurase
MRSTSTCSRSRRTSFTARRGSACSTCARAFDSALCRRAAARRKAAGRGRRTCRTSSGWRALELASEGRNAESARLLALRERLLDGLLERIPDIELTGHRQKRLPGHLSLIIRGLEAQNLLIALDLAGIAASSGSACASGAPTPSGVLRAMGYAPDEALGALRLTLGRLTTETDIDVVLDKLPDIVRKIRAA